MFHAQREGTRSAVVLRCGVGAGVSAQREGMRLQGKRGMTVAAVLKQKGESIISVGPTTPCVRIAEIIAAQRIGALVVMDDDNALLGIVSERDVVKAIARHREKALSLTAAELMTPNPVVATPETTVGEAMEMMDRGYFRHLPVMRDGKPAGIISIRDLVKYRMMQQQNDVETLTSYVWRAGT